MLKIVLHAARAVRWLSAAHGRAPMAPAQAVEDPFADPRLRGMTLAQLADLPFERPPAPGR